MGGIGVMNCGTWDVGGAGAVSGACWLELELELELVLAGGWGGGGVEELLGVCLSCVVGGGGGAVLCEVCVWDACEQECCWHPRFD